MYTRDSIEIFHLSQASKRFGYLATLGTRVSGFPFSSTQSMTGGGSPLARQSITIPDVFENRTTGSGTLTKAGPKASVKDS